ncbi:glycohydrolase toxin TNT-related protein [Pseudomonas cichorii]|uniref:glycohydrolase toxin TNT-related protein n=1 Tax=Pseudomonas cichorii TaxID=36746 RepID=UPI001C8AA77A|nr:glycohydrolase toxin TNT-related protein [Pseudomonas cichorii]MBX8528743.1 glycohydrolase toxin TNT-related protein [Pseudomonas cichorii]
MVAIVAGNGLGLFNTSLNSLGGNAVGGQSNQGQAAGQAMVNISNGNLVLRFTDEQLSGLGQDLLHTRTYNTQGGLSDGDADGWRWDGERSLLLAGNINVTGSQLVRTSGDGHQTVYQWNGTRYQSTEGDGAHDTVVWDATAGQMVWTDGSSRLAERYDTNGRLLSVTDANGTQINYSYDASGRLSSVRDSSGQELVLNYNASGKLERLDTRNATGGMLTQQVYYGYDAQGRLINVSTDLSPDDNSIVDGNVYRTGYAYDGASFRISSIVQSDGTSTSFTYQLLDGEYRIKTVTDSSGTTTFNYDIISNRTDVLNGLGQQWSYFYDANDLLIEVQTPAVNGQRLSTRYSYDLDGNVIRITDGRGNAITYQYDANGNTILERDAGGTTVVRIYNSNNQQLNEIRYSATAVLDSSTGLWAEPPASTAQVSRLSYDSNNRVRFIVDGRGQVTEYRYNAQGLRVQEVSYRDALFELAGLTPQAVLTESQLVVWAGSRDKTRSTLTELSYDYRGNLSRRVTYSSVDAVGGGVQESSLSVTEYIYSQHGQLLQTLVVRGADRSQKTVLSSIVYDGLGRVLSSSDSAGTRINAYNGTSRTVSIINSAGLTVTQTYNGQGQLISLTQTASGQTPRSTAYVYDAAGRQVMVQDATGVRSYTFYDEAGRVSALVDGVGAITEYSYNAAGQRVQEKRYATLVDTSGWYDGATVLKMLIAEIRPLSGSADRVTAFTYDNAGRLSTSTDAVGVLATFTYDGQGRLVKQQTGDRTTRFFYDASGHQSGQLDAEGYLLENRYDATGRLTQSIRYANVTVLANRASATLDVLRQPSAGDLSSWYYYDAAGRQVGSVDEKQFVTETVYDEASNTQKTIRYATAYTASISDATAFSTIKNFVATGVAQTATTVFDAQGRVARRIASDGSTTAYEYDSAGRLVRETQAQGSAEERSTRTRYDAFGQTIGKLLGEASARIATGMSDTEVSTIYAQYGLTYQYDANGRVASATDALGNRTLSYYDAAGRLTHVVNALGEVSETVYSAFGDVRERTAITERLAATNTTVLSGGVLSAQVKTLLQAIRNAASDNRRTYDYDSRGLLTSTTDALGYVTHYAYNAFGNQTSITRAISTGSTVVSNMVYNKRGELTGRVEDVGGLARSSATAYDAFGRVISQVDGRGLSVATSYASNGRVITITNALNEGQTSEYDAFGRVLKQADALGNITTYAYNDSARSLTVTTPDGVSVVSLKNRHGQILTVTNGTGAVTRYSYNKDGQLVTSQDALNQSTTNAYDKAGRLLTVTDALGRITRYSYDAANRVLTRTDANNSVTSYRFDGQGRQVRVVDAEGKAEQRATDYVYDSKGQQLQVIQDPNGLKLTTSYTYDGIGQQIQVVRGTVTSSSQQTTSYEFDKLGRRIAEHQDPSGLNLTTRYSYNGNDQVTRKIDAAGNSTLYVYDNAGRVSSTIDALGYVSENKYDANGRVIETVRYARPVQVPAAGSSDGRTLTLNGSNVTFTALEKVAIDPAKTYTVRVKLRQVAGEGIVYAGVVTYDSAGNVIANPYANSYSYNATEGVKLTPEMGWRTFEGTISGTNAINASASPKKFLAGSVSAVPLLLYNYGADNSGDPDRLVEVDSLELIDTATGQVLNVNANTNAGSANWSGSIGNINSASGSLSVERLQSLLRPDGADRRTRFVYDAVGRQRYVIDAQGAVTENKYDANGQLTETVRYARPVQVPAAGSSDGRTLTLNGSNVTFTALEKVAIDPAKTYTVRVKLRQVAGEGIVYAGVVTYDSAGNVIANPYANSYSYNATEGVKLTPEMGWRTFEGTISGTNAINASASPKKFLAGSVSAVPLLLYNYGADNSGDPDRLVEVDSLELIDTATGQVLNVNANTNAGSANWSGSIGNINSASGSLSVERLQSLLRPDRNSDRTTTYTYDAVGQQKTVTDAAGKVESYTYDGLGNRKTLTNKNGDVWTYSYDLLNRLVEEITPAVTVSSITEAGVVKAATRYLVTSTAYDALGNVTSRSEGRLRSSVTADSALDDLSEVRTTAYTYDNLDRQILTISPGWYNKLSGSYQQSSDGTANTFQVSTEVTFDSFGNAVRNRVRVNNSGLAATDFVDSYKVYDTLGQVSYDIDALKGVTAYSYDSLGQTTRTVRYANALAQAVPVKGYYLGTDITVTTLVPNADQDRTLTTTYDTLGRKTAVQQNQVSLYTFSGNVATSILITAAPTTLYSYDAFGQVIRETQVARNASGVTAITGGSSVHYYDVAGNRIGSVDALGNYTRMEYNVQGKLSRQVEYGVALSSWNESVVPGEPIASSNDRRTRYDYDAMGRLSQVTQEGVRYWQQTVNASNGVVSATPVVGNLVVSHLTYDGVGNTRTVTDVAGSVTTTDYNALGQVSKVTEPARVTAKNGAIDPFSAGSVLASPTITYALNAFGQILVETRSAGRTGDVIQAGSTQTTRTRYDSNGYEVRGFDASGVATTYKVDVAGRRIEQSLQTSVVLSGWTVGGSALSRNQTLRRSFTYDVLGQQVSTTDWYTAADNTQKGTTTSALYNRFGEATSQLLNGNLQTSYQYDQTGRVVQQQNAQGVTKMDYDLSGKVTRSNQVGGVNADDDRITYTRYDNLGRALEQHLPAFEANLNADTLNNITLTLATPIIRQTYDRWGNMLSRTDARGYITTYTYDHNNKQLTETLPVTDILRENGTSYRASLIHEKRYDGSGLLIQETDLVGPYAGVATSTELRTRQHVYNQAGELVRDVDALGYSRNYLMDSNGNRVATQDAVGTVLIDRYDAMDRQVSHGIVRNGAAVTLLTNQYDQAGRLVGEISGSTAVEETLVSNANADSSSTTTGVAGNVRYTLFDERGNVVGTRNESKIEKKYTYSESNRKVEELDGLGNKLSWVFDEGVYGRLTSSKDLGGNEFYYFYNDFGQTLRKMSSSVSKAASGEPVDFGGASGINYIYYSNGALKSSENMDSIGPGEVNSLMSIYEYNLTGEKVRSVDSHISKSSLVLVWNASASSETRYRFDERSRLKEANAPVGTALRGDYGDVANTAKIESLRYDFDEYGNRRRAYMDTTSQLGLRTVVDTWNKFDNEDRVLVGDGFVSGGQVVAGKLAGKAKGYSIVYDGTGRRLASEQWVNTSASNEVFRREEYLYNDVGQVVSSASRTISRALAATSSQLVMSQGGAVVDFSTTYDDRSNRMGLITFKGGVALASSFYSYRGDGKLSSQVNHEILNGVQRKTQATFYGENAMIDAVGNQKAYRYVVYNSDGVSVNYTGAYSKSYVLMDSYKESETVATWSLGGTPGNTFFMYSATGVLSSVFNGVGYRAFSSNADGQLTAAFAQDYSDSKKVQNYFYYNGQALANVGTASVAEISDTYTPISTDYPGLNPKVYLVAPGDTLERISQTVWGDPGMWYLIADANGLDPAKPLLAGESLQIPNVVSSVHNNASTFKLYDANDVIGNTTPSPELPPPPKPKKKKSSGLASVVMVVVAVVATVLTAGAAAPAAAAVASSSAISGLAMTGAAVLSGSIAGSIGWAGLGAAVLGGMAGGVASQLAGRAMGVVDGFSWGQVAVGGITAGITAGFGTLAQTGSLGAWASTAAEAMKTGGAYGSGYAALGTFNYANSQIANRIVGLDTTFSWRNVAASAIGATIAGYAGRDVEGLWGAAARGQASAFASAILKDKWFGGGRPNYAAVAGDAFGNTLGNYMVSQAINSGESRNLDASLATNQFQRMLDSGELPDTLTTKELSYLARETEKNGGVLPDYLRRRVFNIPGPLFSASVYADTDLMSTDATNFDTGNTALDMAYGLNSVIHNGVALGVNGIWAGVNAVPIAWAELSGRTFEQASQDVLAAAMAMPGGVFAGRLLAPSAWLSKKVDPAFYKVLNFGELGNDVPIAISDDVPIAISDAAILRARVKLNILISRAGNEASAFRDFVSVEGRLQEQLFIWPPNRGRVGPVEVIELQPGFVMDRFGFPSGRYLSPQGTPFSDRALPSAYQSTQPYSMYLVVKPIPNVVQSRVLPWFGQRGMGVQLELPGGVNYLDPKNGYVRLIHREY